MRDDMPVPEPGEAGRGDDEEIHYYEVDETNVSKTKQPPAPEEAQESEDR